MGYGVWNAIGLDRGDAPITVHIDYQRTSHDEFKDMQSAGHVADDESFEAYSQWESEDEFNNMASTVCAAGKHLAALGVDVARHGHRNAEQGPMAWALHGDRDQYLKAAFTAGKVGVWWQEEPFMGLALCMVVAPQYQLDDNHDVWMLDDDEFARQHRLSIARYKQAATRQAQLLTSFMLAWVERECSAVTAKRVWRGSGYTGTAYTIAELTPFASIERQLVDALLTREQTNARRIERREARQEKRRAQCKAAVAGQIALMHARVL